jgi:hypothetical protein
VSATRAGSGERKKLEESGDSTRAAATEQPRALRFVYELPVGRGVGLRRKANAAARQQSPLAWCGARPGFSVLSLYPPIASYASAGPRPLNRHCPASARVLAFRVSRQSAEILTCAVSVQLSSSNEPATTSTGTIMRPVARRLGRIQLNNLPFVALLLLTAVSVDGVPLRIANDGIDSVVLAPIGRETIIIDTASNFHGQ